MMMWNLEGLTFDIETAFPNRELDEEAHMAGLSSRNGARRRRMPTATEDNVRPGAKRSSALQEIRRCPDKEDGIWAVPI